MNKKMLNEVNTIRKMMGLLTESVTFTNTESWGLNQKNANQFIQKATDNRTDAFMFNGVIYKLQSMGENSPSSISFENENMVFRIGLLMYSNGYPYIIDPDMSETYLETMPGGNKTVTIKGYDTPDSLRQRHSSQVKDLKTAQELFTNTLKKFPSTLQEEIKNSFGENLSRLKLNS